MKLTCQFQNVLGLASETQLVDDEPNATDAFLEAAGNPKASVSEVLGCPSNDDEQTSAETPDAHGSTDAAPISSDVADGGSASGSSFLDRLPIWAKVAPQERQKLRDQMSCREFVELNAARDAAREAKEAVENAAWEDAESVKPVEKATAEFDPTDFGNPSTATTDFGNNRATETDPTAAPCRPLKKTKTKAERLAADQKEWEQTPEELQNAGSSMAPDLLAMLEKCPTPQARHAESERSNPDTSKKLDTAENSRKIDVVKRVKVVDGSKDTASSKKPYTVSDRAKENTTKQKREGQRLGISAKRLREGLPEQTAKRGRKEKDEAESPKKRSKEMVKAELARVAKELKWDLAAERGWEAVTVTPKDDVQGKAKAKAKAKATGKAMTDKAAKANAKAKAKSKKATDDAKPPPNAKVERAAAKAKAKVAAKAKAKATAEAQANNNQNPDTQKMIKQGVKINYSRAYHRILIKSGGDKDQAGSD